MAGRTWEIAVGLAAAAAFWTASGTQRERPLLTDGAPELVRMREAVAAARPDDSEATRALAQAYLDAEQSGLAVVLLRTAPAGSMADVRVQHLYARALLDQGRSEDALAVENRVVATCASLAEGTRTPETPVGCDSILLASAMRRVDILRELVTLGVRDVRAHPEASLIAYQNATREVRTMLQ